MKEDNLKNECSVVVSSCDAFSDVWEAFFTLFFKYWPDCPFPIYLISETKKYPDNRVTTLNIGEDKKWATNIKNALKRVNTKNIIYLQEDYLLESKVNTEKIINLIKILSDSGAAYLKLCPSPAPYRKFGEYKDIGEIKKGSNYSISLQAAIWNKKIMEGLLIDGESGWDMEFKGSIRTADIKEPLLSVYSSVLNYFYATAIKKGVWFYDAIKLCEKEGIKIDKTKRRIETFNHYVLRVTKFLHLKNILKIFLFKVKRKMILISRFSFNLYLFFKKSKQISDFYVTRKTFFENYDLINKQDISKFITPHWHDLNKKYENYLRIKNVPVNFLRDRVIGYTMFVSSGGGAMKAELDFLENKYSKGDLGKYLEEEAVGFPIILSRKYLSSHNSIRHLYHISRFIFRTNVEINSIKTVVEWGGGYGNFAKIFLRLQDSPQKTTYVIIDTPLFSCIQWLYLSVVLGKDKVNFVRRENDKIVSEKINIIPLGFVEKVNLKPDLFVSTWALSESSPFSQDFVLNKNFFGAKHLLIGYQESNPSLPDADRINLIVDEKRKDTIKEIIDFIPGNYYVFK
ncbi:MAG: hypothetical protein UT05_C0002G0078 [Parcubacteria group bacterium GW2011_GWF2_38_76]|nr:MAG: hypothetical protein UT05_C0002G0078 [Parcubacteria group bacterium GW2011_GWF2_38_76]HBM45764.1 hypothetical protein [Patescibacteria group bacterium]